VSEQSRLTKLTWDLAHRKRVTIPFQGTETDPVEVILTHPDAPLPLVITWDAGKKAWVIGGTGEETLSP